MKLTRFEHRHDYVFLLTFANGRVAEADLSGLIAAHVSPSELASARIDPDWGCLEFRGGAIDIAPATLYQWAESHQLCPH